MEELCWQKESLLQYTMSLLQGPKDYVLPTLITCYNLSLRLQIPTFSWLFPSILFRLPELSKYIEQWENAVDGEETTVSINQVNNLSALLEDVEIAWKALTLPILEPLTTDMLQKVTKIVKGKIFMKKQVFRFVGPYPIVLCTC